MGVQINNGKSREAQVKEFLNEHSFEEIHEMLDKLYNGWALSASVTSERNERLRTLIFYDELKQFFEQMEEND